MSRPTRATLAGQVYLDLQNMARRDRRPTDEVLALYALEGFLDRLSRSPDAHRFVLKGGTLLAAYDLRRPTRDVDLHAVAMPNDTEHILGLVRSIGRETVDDGLAFDVDGATAETIRDQDDYSGVRVSMRCQLAKAQIAFHVDVSIGDVPRWRAWIRKQRLGDRLPDEFGIVLTAASDFADPAIAGETASQAWSPELLVWMAAELGRGPGQTAGRCTDRNRRSDRARRGEYGRM